MAKDDVEEWMLLVAESIDANSEIMHYGVKGMKWGVRKDRPKYEVRTLGPDHLQVTTKYGETLDLVKNKSSALTRYIAKNNKRFAEAEANRASLTIKNAQGKSVGEASLRRRKDKKSGVDELYLNWVGIDSKQRGKGYATAVLDASEKFGRSLGVERMLLEVPGNSPDARHIYSKMGFESTNRFFGNTGDIWGGLEEMEYRFNKAKHSDETTELQHYGIPGMKWGRRRKEGPDGRVEKGAPKETDSDDAKNATAAKAKAKANGISSLSNKELQDLNNRMNLEQNYSRLTSESVGKGRDYIGAAKTVLDISDEVSRGVSKVPAPVRKAVKEMVVSSLPPEVVSVGRTVITVGGHVKTGARVGIGLAESVSKKRG